MLAIWRTRFLWLGRVAFALWTKRLFSFLILLLLTFSCVLLRKVTRTEVEWVAHPEETEIKVKDLIRDLARIMESKVHSAQAQIKVESMTGDLAHIPELKEHFVEAQIKVKNLPRDPTCIGIREDKLVEFATTNKYPNGVPKIIHYVYKNEEIPTQYSPLIRKCMQVNSEAKFLFWSDMTSAKFIRKSFPQHLAVYKSYLMNATEQLKISDVNRYFIMFKLGGIYMDMDTECQKPFDLVMKKDGCILAKEVEEQSRILWNFEFQAMNCLMACRSGHPFFKYVLQNLKVTDTSSVLEQTGPFFLTRLYQAYSNISGHSRNKSEHITLADAYTFNPLADKFLEMRCGNNIDGKWRIQGCKDLPRQRQNEDTKKKQSITIHMYMHLGYEDRHHLITSRENICQTFTNLFLIII